MDRRRFVQALALAAAVGPGSLRRALADATLPPKAPATTRRRPLLAIVVPDDEAARGRYGEAWGRYLATATDEQLAPLAGCDLACATIAKLQAIDPRVEDGRWLAILFGAREAAPLPSPDLLDDEEGDEVAQIAAAVRAIAAHARRPRESIDALRTRLLGDIPGSHWVAVINCRDLDSDPLAIPCELQGPTLRALVFEG